MDNEPTPLLWAVGLTDPSELDAYSQLGFNTVELVISLPSEETWKAAEALAAAAAQRGMLVMVAIAPTPAALGGVAASPWDEEYRTAVSTYLKPIIERSTQLPGLVGWVLEAADAEGLRFNEADFRQYLLQWHGSLSGLVANWGAPVGGLTPITEGFVAGLDAGKPLGLGRASLDLARYRSQAYGDVLSIWAREIRTRDRRHVILAGRQHSYRAAISVPEACDGMLLGLYPGVAEDDPQTHNVQGVDIARRGNEFAALPVLKVAAASSGAQLASWIAQAVLHGAAGIGLADWKDLRDDSQLQTDVRAALLATRQSKLCPRVPAASAAILYEPFAAGGFAGGRPLYGWLTGASISEPGALARALAHGTIFGQVDYLAQSSLGSVRLDRYAVIVAPLAFSLTAAEQATLAAYVAQGGTLIADLGAGLLQSASLERLPPALAELFGVAPVPGANTTPPSFMAMIVHPRFPSLTRQLGTAGPPNPGSFDQPIYFVLLSAGAAPVLAQWDGAPAFAGVMARQHGKGWALYATTRLWQNWMPGNPAFDAFHRDLFGLDSSIALKQSASVVAQDDVALFEDGSIFVLKHSAEPAEVLLRNPSGRVYRIWGGMEEIRPASVSANSRLVFGRSGLQVAEPLPIEIATAAQQVVVQVVDYTEAGLSFVVYGPATQMTSQPNGDLAMVAAGDTVVQVRVRSGEYRVARGSRHEITVLGLTAKQPELRETTVGADGVLAFDARANTVVSIKRLSSAPAAGAASKSRS